MNKIIITFLLTSFLFSQSPVRSIEVKGTGSYKTMPDLGVLTVEASVVHEQFAEAVKGLNAKTEKLTAQLQMIGFKKDDIKTTDFSVSKNIVWENSSNVEKGYVARQNISIEFPNTKEKIGAIITSFMGSENDVRFSFNFTLSDAKEKLVQDELLKRAVNDARSRAEVIAAAAKQTIGSVQRISYGAPFQRPAYQMTMVQASKVNEGIQSAGFDVKELSFTDEVTMEWELK
ncbi:MAG: SIMPL domain-containing protein [Bacteroidota bacterium]|jgi:hypothetical protein